MYGCFAFMRVCGKGPKILWNRGCEPLVGCWEPVDALDQADPPHSLGKDLFYVYESFAYMCVCAPHVCPVRSEQGAAEHGRLDRWGIAGAGS